MKNQEIIVENLNTQIIGKNLIYLEEVRFDSGVCEEYKKSRCKGSD